MNGTAERASSFEYDRVAYPGAADQSINLRNLEVTATMFGGRPAELSHCRVLEIGCAGGTNLLPFAFEFPGSTFVGVDLAKDRIHVAKEIANEAGLQNVDFRCASVIDLDASIGTFDYILCPGVFSWVGDAERQAILRVCRECLAPDGVAAISYNTLPGWNWSGSVRDFIRHVAGTIEEPQQKIAVARNAVEFLAANVPSNSIHASYYQRVRDRLRGQSDAYLYHDYITDQNRPFYFNEFAALANSNELKFLGEADFRHSSGFGLEMAGRAAVVQTPPEQREQLLDFLLNTSYRSSMLCHAQSELRPRVQHEWISELHLVLVDPMEGFSFEVSDDQPLTLPFENGAVTVTDPFVKASLRQLIDRWPQTITVQELYAVAKQSQTDATLAQSAIDSSDTLSRTMLAFYGAGLIRPFKTPPRWVDAISDHPMVSPTVRIAAARGFEIVNQWHQNIRNLSEDHRFILSLLSGSRDSRALAAEYKQFCEGRSDQTISPQEFVIESLSKFATQRLLVE